MSKILGGRLQKPISQSLASLVASLSLVPPSFSLYRSRCSRSPLSLSLLIVAIAFSVRTSSQINLITHTQTAWERSTHLSGPVAHEVTHTPSGTQNSCQVERAGCLPRWLFHCLGHAPRRVSDRSAATSLPSDNNANLEPTYAQYLYAVARWVRVWVPSVCCVVLFCFVSLCICFNFAYFRARCLPMRCLQF